MRHEAVRDTKAYGAGVICNTRVHASGGEVGSAAVHVLAVLRSAHGGVVTRAAIPADDPEVAVKVHADLLEHADELGRDDGGETVGTLKLLGREVRGQPSYTAGADALRSHSEAKHVGEPLQHSDALSGEHHGFEVAHSLAFDDPVGRRHVGVREEDVAAGDGLGWEAVVRAREGRG